MIKKITVLLIMTAFVGTLYLPAEEPVAENPPPRRYLQKRSPGPGVRGGPIRGQRHGGDWWGGAWYNYYPLGPTRAKQIRVYDVYPYYEYYPYYNNYYYYEEEIEEQ